MILNNAMEYDNKQKMMKRDELLNKNSQAISICSQLNLNPDKLNVEILMSNGIYRRLYNIVKNDMSRSDLSFRRNLIKELYFLLQITPIIKVELKDHFLEQVEKWYNLNDHKKINLASNKLNKLLNIVHQSKKEIAAQQGTVERPKTGVAWNQNVSPFLRPYTAKRQSNSNMKPGKGNRPQSSKCGGASTKVDTNDDIYIRQFTTNIQEELEISQDFLQKHRTNHPDYEPTYEQLYNILKKIETHSDADNKDQTLQIPIKKNTRYAKSAIPRKKEVEIKEANVQSYNCIADEQEEVVQFENQQRQRDSDQSSNDQDEEILYVNEHKEAFNKSKVQVNTEENEETEDNLYKYHHFMQNKLVQAVREDRQMAKNYVNFARSKNALKRQLNRRSQSKRLLSAKRSSKEYKVTRNSANKQNMIIGDAKFYDLTQDPLCQAPEAIDKYPLYNKRQFLKKRYEQPVRMFKKLNNTEQISDKVKGNVKRPMTAFVRFHQPLQFDPLSNHNVKKYNQDVLEQIQKIKIRMGTKCSASTESLMKALYVDTSPNLDVKWQEQNPFYGMVSKGKEKKLKKKGRKLKSKTKL